MIRIVCGALLLLVIAFHSSHGAGPRRASLLREVAEYVSALAPGLDRLPADRLRVLQDFASKIVSQIDRQGAVKLKPTTRLRKMASTTNAVVKSQSRCFM